MKEKDYEMCVFSPDKADPGHPAHVQLEPAPPAGLAGVAVTAAADTELQSVLPDQPHRRHHVLLPRHHHQHVRPVVAQTVVHRHLPTVQCESVNVKVIKAADL